MARQRVKEFLFPVAWGVVLFAVGSVPYIYAIQTTPPGMEFMGVVGRGALHAHGYTMFARQSQDGFNLFENKMTPEPLPRRIFNLEYWVYGRIARWTGLSLQNTFHVHRGAALLVMISGLYYLARLCLGSVFQRRFLLLWVTLGSGLGWILWVVGQARVMLFPYGAWIMELAGLGMPVRPAVPLRLARDVAGVGMFGYLINKPHFMLAGGLLVFAVAFVIRGEQTGKTRYFALSGCAGLLCSLFRAFCLRELAILYFLAPLFLNARERQFNLRRAGHYVLCEAMILPAAFNVSYLKLFKVMGEAQLTTPVGTVFQYVVWYGIPFVCLVFCLRGVDQFHTLRPPYLILALWIGIAFTLAQMYPFVKTGEESTMYSMFVVPGLIAVAGPLTWLKRRLLGTEQWIVLSLDVHRVFGPVLQTVGPRRFAVGAAGLLLMVSSFSSLLVYGRMFRTLESERQLYYLDGSTCRALKWLSENSEPGEVVLGSPVLCAFIPELSGNKTFTGHDLLTTRRSEKDVLADRFFAARGDEEFKRGIVARWHVDYVIFGPLEQRDTGMKPGEHRWLSPVFRSGRTTVFRVLSESS